MSSLLRIAWEIYSIHCGTASNEPSGYTVDLFGGFRPVIDSEKAAANRRAREEKKRAYLQAMMDRYQEEFRSAAGDAAPEVARRVHATIDLVLERDLTRSPDAADIQCRRGCSHCCRGPVEISPQEAALLADAARAAGIAVDRERLERQRRYTVESWREQPEKDRDCVFLGQDGACRVYEARPNACRKLLVTSPPELCDRDKHPSDAPERWYSWESEIVAAASLETFGSGMLPMLLGTELERTS